MQILHFVPGHAPELAGAGQSPDDSQGFFWLDIERTEENWHDKAQAWLGLRLYDKHIQDTQNENHPPYYDGTDDYDLLVVRALSPDCLPEAPATRPVAFIVTGNAVITVRPQADPVFTKLHQRILANQKKSPTSLSMLLYMLLDQIIDALLAQRDVTSVLLSRWQECLLDSNNPFSDWHPLMRLHGQLRRLEVVSESQLDALGKWREQTTLPVDGSLNVRFNDLQEHLHRVYSHAIVVQHDIDALVQIYFSANTQRTNEILQFLTIISAVFLPLNLLASLFGMNFSNLPLLQAWYGPGIVAGLMIVIVSGLMLWFHRRKWV